MNEGSGLAYKDQRTAEAVAAEERRKRIQLLEELQELNQSLDSLALDELIKRQRMANF